VLWRNMMARYLDEDFDWQDCEVLERNGNLRLIRDRNTGQEDWLSPHEVKDND